MPDVPAVERSRDDATVVSYGHCADFCTLEGPTHGQTVEEHGPWCMTPFTGEARGVDNNRQPVELYLDLVERYWHGVYRREDVYGRSTERYIRLTVAGEGFPEDVNDDAAKIYLSSGEIRRLAAALIHTADAADMLTDNINDARARREAERDER